MGYTALKRDLGDADGEDEMQSFRDWLESPVVAVTIQRQHGQFYATARLFDITGVGKTQDEALRDVAGLVDAYLRSCFKEGRSYAAAVRKHPAKRASVGGAIAFAVEVAESILERRRALVLPSALRPSH